MNIGTAFFTNPNKPIGGFYYHNGKVAEFSSIGSLDQSVIWITNIGYKVWTQGKYWSSPHLRSEQFLRLKVQQMCRELSVTSTNLEGLETLGVIIHNACEQLISKFDLSPQSANYKLNQLIQPIVLPERYFALPIEQSEELFFALDNAYQGNQGAKKPASTGATLVNFFFPRVAFNTYLLNLPYPVDNNWSKFSFKDPEIIAGVENGKQIEGTDRVIEGLITLSKQECALINVEVKNTEKRYQQGFSFGVDVQPKVRTWAALPEVIELLKFNKLRIRGGYKTGAGLLEFRPEIQQEPCFDYAKGLVSENITFSLSDSVPMNGRNRNTGLGVYLKAYDRICCSKLAKAFMKEGFSLAGFGGGCVNVWSSNSEVDLMRLNKIAHQHGAMCNLKQGVVNG